MGASAASEVFASRFQLTLEDLVDLFSNRSWRDAPYGGNQWREVTQAVIALREALDRKDAASTRDLVESIPVMRHNTVASATSYGTLTPRLLMAAGAKPSVAGSRGSVLESRSTKSPERRQSQSRRGRADSLGVARS